MADFEAVVFAKGAAASFLSYLTIAAIPVNEKASLITRGI
jgi:hypothetical protein